uniref:Putative portal protein n=1 Tax=viral metagenome TaxID=1070528 RepID=A0A6M3IP72_9ZZZZ
MPRTSFNYAREVDGWQSSIIMACIGWIQRTFPEAPLMVQKRDADGEWIEVLDSPLVQLLDNPNPFYDGLLLQSAFIADLTISGNAYLLKVRSGAGRTVQLWWTPSSLIEPKWPSSGTEFISHYEYTPGGQQVKIDSLDVVHYRLGIDPNNLRKGRSPLQALLREVFTDDEAANMTATLLRNMGVPGLLISPEKDATISPQDADAVKEYVRERTTGDRRGQPLVIGSATKVESFGFNPQQMDLKQLRRIPEERISAVLGVPAIVAGLGAGLDRSTFSNMAEAREMAYESGIIPLQRITGSQTKHQLLSEFVDAEDLVNWRVVYDLSEIRVLQEDEDKLSLRTIAQVNGGICKVTDAQRILGLPEDDSQDFYLRGFNMLSVRSGETGNEILVPQEEPKQLKSGDWSEEMKTLYWKRIDRERLGWWGLAFQKVEPLYYDEQKAVEKAIKKGDMVGNAEKAIDSLSDKWTEVLEKLTFAIVEHFGKEIAPETMGKQAWSFDPTHELVRAWIVNHAAESVKTILATNLEDVRKVLLASTDEGLTVPQIGRKLREFYSDRSSFKAMRVARTEVTQSASFGSLESAKQGGVMRKKIWLTSRDDRVRIDHLDMEGEEVELDGTFSNGCEAPGLGGDSSQVINCRCVLQYTTG